MAEKKWRPSLIAAALLAMLGWLSPFATSATTAAPEAYTVASGDTLSGIARRFGVDAALLARINGIQSPNLLRVGQALLLGDSSAAEPWRTHVVGYGETLSGIAQVYGVAPAHLAAINGLTNRDFLALGQLLRIPGGQGDTTNALPNTLGQRSDASGQGSVMQVPYRTQFDGTRYEESNCGPAALGMLISYFGVWPFTDSLRRSVNEITGYWGLDGGADWESLAYAAESRGFRTRGLYEGPKRYRKWTIGDLVQEVQQGHPAMLLVRYWSLPGHEAESWWGDHYIVFLGLNTEGEVVYHDSAFKMSAKGTSRTMSQDRLLRAWGRTATGINYSAMSLEQGS